MATGLVFSRKLTKEEWLEIGAGLRDRLKSTLWQIGDWILYGEDVLAVTDEQREKDSVDKKRLGYGMAIEIGNMTGYSPSFVSSIKSVCQRIPLRCRAPNLTMHHAREIVLAVPDAQFEFWIDKALKEGLSTRQLRIELRKSLRTEPRSPSTDRPALFAQEHSAFVRKFMAESEGWGEAEWIAHAAWHRPILEAFRGRGL